MSATVTKPSSGALKLAAAGAAALIVMLAALLSTLAVVLRQSTCAPDGAQAAPSTQAQQEIPSAYLTLYRHAAAKHRVPWQVLAAIGSIETDHGRSTAPGVRDRVNSYGCCAGPMQFNLTDGPPSTWKRYALDGDRDGTKDVYDPHDAIPAAANYLRTLLRNADGNLSHAIYGYNHSQAYVNDVLAHARAYAGQAEDQLVDTASPPVADVCAGGGIDAAPGPADLGHGTRLGTPQAFRALPSWAMAARGRRASIDARLYRDVLWILRRYHLRVTAARETGHNTHGDGTAVDLIPADGVTQAVWDASAGRLARHLGWTPACAAAGTRPACQLVPATQFVGYDGYPSHGSPRTCTGGCPAHIHISWTSPCYGSASLTAPCNWVMAFSDTRSRDPRMVG